jgi:hypothetical protein
MSPAALPIRQRLQSGVCIILTPIDQTTWKLRPRQWQEERRCHIGVGESAKPAAKDRWAAADDAEQREVIQLTFECVSGTTIARPSVV